MSPLNGSPTTISIRPSRISPVPSSQSKYSTRNESPGVSTPFAVAMGSLMSPEISTMPSTKQSCGPVPTGICETTGPTMPLTWPGEAALPKPPLPPNPAEPDSCARSPLVMAAP